MRTSWLSQWKKLVWRLGSSYARKRMEPSQKPPENAATLLPKAARELFCENRYHGPTTGFCLGYLQANIVVLPNELADDFEEFCRRNYGPLPLLYRSKPGEVGAPPLAQDSDIRTDVPRYRVYSKGRLVDDTFDLLGFDWHNRATFYLGCSLTYEKALQEAGIEARNLQEGKNVAMYRTSVRTYPVGNFDCEMFVSMRPIPRHLVSKVVAITSQFPATHGAPVHIGDPARIGIEDIHQLTEGDAATIHDDDVPVFWACGVTVALAVASAKPDLAFTHYPGHLFFTDQKGQPEPMEGIPRVISLSRDGDPFFASVVGESVAQVFTELEKVVLDDPGHRGIAQLFLKSDLLKATLALSHANRVAITTGFPCHTDYEQKEETDGLPGALTICQALVALGKDVTLISDNRNLDLFESCVASTVSTGAMKAPVPVLPFSTAKELFKGTSSKPAFDCLLAIERAGRAVDGTYRTMNKKDISQYLEPVDEVFVSARSNPLVTTIGIGDGGNELGMGKVLEKVRENIPHGEVIACVTPADFLIAAGVSNWGGYAIALGLYLVSTCPFHWRYRNHGINAEKPPKLNVDDFLPSASQTSCLLQHMNDLGVRDGINKKLEQYVDGLPLDVHLKKLAQIRELAN